MQEEIILPNFIYTEVEVYDNDTRKKNTAMSFLSGNAFYVENQEEYERFSGLIKEEIKIWLLDKYKFFKKYKNDQLLLVDKQGRRYVGKVIKGRYLTKENIAK